jgi:hypothetical protein
MQECNLHVVGWSLPLAERGTVARSNPRLVAGAGVVTAFLLVGGPSVAVAIAEPGHSGRGDRDNSDRNWGDSRGGYNRGGDDRGDRRGNGDSNRKSDNGFRGDDDGPSFGNDDAPQSRVGSGRTEIQQVSPGEVSDEGSGSSGRSGSDHPGAPKANFDPPRVTVGNGRSPGVQDDDRERRFGVTAPEPAPAPPPPPPPPPPPAPEPSWTDRIYTPPAMPKQLGVTPTASWTEPLWGIAGLLLIPAAGAVLGYRQARAAKAVAELGRP